ncbi:54S ribosomal protein L51 [Lachancea thermotolerans]|uniref:Large ribosomal subunit protein mL43 n=1 Tax=Lachancea thermotolerans (strain ATCC 56472 / CBS 6340 / NRRL Y-8284) TaxID=559295 RepID=C5DL86_LACTC|nr:mitochondrial 54S ribosomal protein MRPL51 [Lachancea thermotolerans CBS 6340]CAR24237.1 KLTH0F10868p [Lachancea thermotolerans CBS 6340]
MVVRALKQTSIARNGLGANYILPCKKVILQYCNWGGSSQGMRDFLTSKRLDILAKKYPQIEFNVLRKSGHPLVRAQYTNGREKVVCVRNLNIDNVENKLKLLKDSSGEILRHRVSNDYVDSLNTSVRGVWSPMHVDPSQRHKV